MSADKEDAARRKQQIIEAATTVFARKGFHGATMDDIVAESGLSKGGLYWYFEGKDDIIAAILRQFFDQEMVGLEAVVAAGGPATAQLLQLARRLAAEMEEAARMLPISLEFYAVAARQEAVRQWIKGYFASYRAGLASLLQQGMVRGEIVDGDAEAAALALIALFEGLFLLRAVDAEAVDLQLQAETAVHLFLQGLAKRADR